ncbi:MAG: AzlD domain-containing protein [Clostridia bacterium]|nr:AzlD domain-containing protein [Clostridia bacterium]
MDNTKFLIYLVVMAGVTYLVRMVPLVLVNKPIKNKYVLSFLYYVPYTVLSVMTVPACFYATDSYVSAIVGFVVAAIAGFLKRSLVQVAVFSSLAVLVTELVMNYI